MPVHRRTEIRGKLSKCKFFHFSNYRRNYVLHLPTKTFRIFQALILHYFSFTFAFVLVIIFLHFACSSVFLKFSYILFAIFFNRILGYSVFPFTHTILFSKEVTKPTCLCLQTFFNHIIQFSIVKSPMPYQSCIFL